MTATVQVNDTGSTVSVQITESQVSVGVPSAVSASAIANTPAGAIAATDVQSALNELDADKQANAIEKSANFTAELHGVYLITATLTVTDPTPAQGHEYVCFIRNGVATIGGATYIAGQTIWRSYHSGAWSNTVIASLGTAQTFSALQTFTSGLTVSSGTTSLQAATCTTLTASGAISSTVNADTSHLCQIINSNAGTSALAALELQNNSGSACRFRFTDYGSGLTSTAFGITLGGYVSTLALGVSCNGLIIGCQSVDKPIIFGINTSEVARFTGGTISTQSFSVKYTTASTSTTTGALVVAGGGAFAKELVTGLGLWLVDGQTAPGATTGYAKIYVDTSDGDLKIIFGDGTIKTIVTDT